jgi:hypothetical protein
VLLDVEERRGSKRLDRIERVEERAAAEKERARRLELLVQPSQQADAAPRRLGLECAPVLRHLGADEARESFAHRGRLGVVADEQGCHIS